MSIPYLHPFLSYRHYPAIYGKHLHAELASIHHDELLREQAELQRYYRTNRQLFASEKIAKYEADIRQRQIRLAELKERTRIISQLERNRLDGLKVEQELRYQQALREMEVDRYLRGKHTIHSQGFSNSLRKAKNQISDLIRQRIYSHSFNSQAKDRSGKRQKQADWSSKKRKSEENDIRKSLMRYFQSQTLRNAVTSKKRIPKYQSCFSAKAFKKHINNSKKLQGRNKSLHNSYLSHHKQQESLKKSKEKNRRVTFSLENTARQNHSGISYQEIQETLAAKGSKTKQKSKNQESNIPKNPICNGSKKIEKRLILSSGIYKDSKWRNTKHELAHLLNTFQNQLKLRQQIKTKINNNPKVISKYRIVIQEK